MKVFLMSFISLSIVVLTSCNTVNSKLEVFAELDQAPGNIAYTDDGELVISYHPFFSPDIRVAKIDSKTGDITPFPNEQWNTVSSTSEDYLDDVLGLRNDENGVIWILDMGTRNNITPKIVGWNTRTDQLERIYPLTTPAVINTSQPQDMVIDHSRGVFVIADEDIARGGDGSRASLILVDIYSGFAWRVLEGHYSTKPDRNKPIVVNDKILGAPIFVGADGITLDKDNEWLYYAPLNGSKVYRIRMDDLLDTSITEEERGTKVEIYSDKENNGGISIDVDGNLYLTNVEGNDIGFVNKEGDLSVFVSNGDLIWPDGVSYNKDGYMYVADSQVSRGAVFNDGQDQTETPFKIFRFKPEVEGIFGR